jgi:hypothetical protein
MNKIMRACGLLLVISLFSISLMAQSGQTPPVSKVFARLSKSLESKSSVVGDELMLRTISDVLVDGQVVIPKGSKLVGHVADVAKKGKDEPNSVLEIIVDKAVTVGGTEMPLQAIIVAIAAPPNPLSSDPHYGMLHSNEPRMVTAGPRGATTAGGGGLSASSKASSTATVATVEIKGGMYDASLLTEDSQGAVGYEGVAITWRLMAPPPITIFTSKAKNVKLEADTQVLIRMASPRAVR